ncbi:hypothetical protein [Terracoccus sp. 273MFTsu3.1]|uniref:hypothetical protein n=1 Tax=Terracoccus sp. 273MFTsu3.1 TaxID=1172188 RepID=UPI0012DBEFE0|nr:hypothetical protein [Terracoccus sp. 273MFTsu3.1]
MTIPNPRDYGLPDDAVVVNINGVVRDLRTVPTEEGGDWVPPTPKELGQVDALDGTPPAPGTGTVWITPVEGYWFASWAHADEGSPVVRHLEGPEGMTHDEAIQWSLAQPAARRMIYDEGQGDFLEVQAGDAKPHL